MTLIMNTTRSGYNPSQCYSTMTVGELIEFLQQYDPDTKIYTGHDRKYTFGEIRESQFEEYYEDEEDEDLDEE